jgi:hypothetical protein
MARFPFYSPQYRIRIGGDNIPPSLRGNITSVHYTDGLEGADRVEVTIANEDLRWLDHPLLQVDQSFALSIGYAPDPLEEVFAGQITGVSASFPSGGIPTLTVVAQDALNRLTAGTRDRAFALNLPCIGKFPIPDPLVVSVVAATDLLIPYPDPVGSALSFLTLLITYAIDPLEAKKAIRIQQGQSDFDFLTTVAKENGWEMYIDHTMEPRGYWLRFLFPMWQPADLTLKWGASLIDFTPKISTVGQVAAVATRLWIAAIGMEFVIVLGWDYDRAAFDLQIYPGFGSIDALTGGAKQGVLRIDAVGAATAPKKILGELLPRLNNRQTASGSTVGNPAIKAGRVIDFQGVGDQYGGKYRVTTATHTLDSGGYRTSFDARKEVWFGSIPTPKGGSGLLRVQGHSVG